MKLRKRILSGLLSFAMLVTAVPFSAGAVAAAEAEVSDALVASYDFNDETLKNAVKESSQATAIVTGLSNYSGTVVYADGRDGSKAIQLGNYGLKLNQQNLGDTYTVTMWAKITRAISANQNVLFLGYHNPELWFSVAGNSSYAIKTWANGGGYSWTQMMTANVGTDWHLLTLTDDGETLTTYIDGAVVNACDTNSPLSGANQDIYVGVNYWDPEFTGLVDDVQVYNKALTEKEVYALYDDRDSAAIFEESGFKVTESVKVHAGDSAKIAVELPTGVYADEAEIIFTSKDKEIASVDEDGKVTGVKEGETTVTTKVTVGTVSKEMVTTVTVKPPIGPDDPFGYLMVHFVEDSAGYAEKIYLDITRGDNPQQWDPLNGRNPILTSKNSTTGVRDPFITYSPETETYYIIATDLRVFGGDNAGWGAWQSNYSTKMNVWSSKDLITWSEGWQYDVALNADGEKEDIYMGMMWAPETTWVDDYYGEGDGAFVVYWSSNTSDGRSKIMYGVTKDFTQETYEFGGVFIDPGHTVIDTTILQTGDKTYHITKDNARGKELYMQVTTAKRWWEPGTQWTTIQTNIGESRFGACEGPATFVDHSNENSFYLFVDDYPTPGYQPMYTSNPDEGWEYLDTSNYFLTPNTKHGGVISLTKAQYDALRNADAVSAVSEDLGAVEVEAGKTAEELAAALPQTAEVNLAYDMGTSKLPVVWDISSVRLNVPGVYEVSGVVQSIGANKNMWVGANGSTSYLASNKVLYSANAIEVTAKVMVAGEGVVVIDKTILQKTVDAAVPVTDAVEYTAETWAVYTKALATAKSLLAEDAVTTQKEVDAAEAALKDAQANLVRRSLEERLELVASYDMTVADGKLVDATANKNDATLYNFAETDITAEGEDKVLTFDGQDNYVALPTGMIETEGFAIEATFKTSTTNFAWLWCLGTKEASTADNYVFVSPRFDSNGIRGGIKYGNELLYPQTTVVPNNTYTTIRVEFDKGMLTLLVDGKKISTIESEFSIQDILEVATTGDVCGYIGKSLWPDPYLTATLTQFDVYAIPENEKLPEIKVELPYEDVAETDWFYNAAYYAFVEGFMTGVNETTFAPGLEMTRAQLAAMLYRLADKPEYTKEAQFPDLEEGAWYLDAVNWAAENGIISGYAHNGLFDPHGYVTREQTAVMLYRYAEYAGDDVDAAADLSEYEDAASVSEYAEKAMQWVVGEGIIAGRDGKLLAPQGTTSRAEGANIIYRYMN